MQALICWRTLTCPTAQTAILGHRVTGYSEKWVSRAEGLFNTVTKRSGLAQAVGLVGLICFIFGVNRYPERPSQQDLSRYAGLVSPSGNSFWTHDQQPLSKFAEFGAWSVEEAFSGLTSIGGAVRLRPDPNDKNRYFIGTNMGVIHQVIREQGSWQSKPIIDLRNSSLEFLYSFELHPQFSSNSQIYVSYRTKKDRNQSYRISVVKVLKDQSVQHDEHEILIDQKITNSEHLGGDLAFDPSGFLLVSVGDNSESFEDIHSQRIDKALFSGILRIDVDQRGGDISHPPKRQPLQGKTFGYFIPNDNPFVGEPNALEEFWAIGFRNPFRISVENVTDPSGTTDSTPYRVWVGEVGQDSIEQVEVASKGTNHLWSFQEGSLPFQQSYLNGRMPTNLHGRPVNAIYEYQHQDQNNCIIGGFIYRGEKFPELKGQYLFGDNQSGRVWVIDPEEPDKASLVLKLPFTKKQTSLVSIAADQDGEILFTSFASWPPVYRLKRADEFSPPRRLSDTGLFSSLTKLSPNSDFTPYDVNAPLWSDGMQKQRWIRLPYGKRIDNENESWRFPPGTVFIKHFEMPVTGPNSTPKKLETRILVTKEDGNVIGCSYLWSEDGSDAILLEERTTLTLPRPYGDRTFDYVLPGVNDCVTCHNRENPVLGFNAEQLNRFPKGFVAQNQLTSLSEAGFLAVPFEKRDLVKADRLRSLDDENASLEERARSYLHANCSFCHFPNAMQRVDIDLRAFAAPGLETLVDIKARLHYQEIDGEKVGWVIRSGSPNQSAIFRRMQTDDREVSMPYAGRTLVDQQALAVIEAWIQSLSP